MLSRSELREHGWDRNAVAREVAAGRWRMHGRQTVALHTASLGLEALCWRAVFEVGAVTRPGPTVGALPAVGVEHRPTDAQLEALLGVSRNELGRALPMTIGKAPRA